MENPGIHSGRRYIRCQVETLTQTPPNVTGSSKDQRHAVSIPWLAQMVRLNFPLRDLPLADGVAIAGSVQMFALLPISIYRPRNVTPQHHVVPEFGRHVILRLGVRIPAMAVRRSGSSRSSIPDDAGLGVTRS